MQEGISVLQPLFVRLPPRHAGMVKTGARLRASLELCGRRPCVRPDGIAN
jgi:hypothetical protein